LFDQNPRNMITNSTTCSETKFSKEAINRQLQKIFLHPQFANSDILRKFLSFIVEQTLSGHSNWLKEYTIATSVLNKPANFKPQENGIVRIHAGRLRRALHQYYNNNGVHDEVLISIPKGSYVPVFIDGVTGITDETLNEQHIFHDKPVIAVTPFRHLVNDQLEDSLAEGLGVLLSTALMRFKNFSVIAYYTMRNLFERVNDIRVVAPAVGAQYIISGDIQSMKNRLRIFVQLIHVNSNEQIWSQMYERKISVANIFEMQDEIAKLIISELEDSWSLMRAKLENTSMVAVA
jgi:TolB-like protein